ncbi:hypothetical protein Rhopal_007269-T1 [Rhodotorula paludigena]|uniref:Proteophosphoglycan ppg4 n=1 Tax=Rhodotorula paludigena TaxID=86838 RepID=A0AAV5GW70_9BASI|nr:hypothetical protein Rhopal_007269-T1 [Rhodotorula paludigena]
MSDAGDSPYDSSPPTLKRPLQPRKKRRLNPKTLAKRAADWARAEAAVAASGLSASIHPPAPAQPSREAGKARGGDAGGEGEGSAGPRFHAAVEAAWAPPRIAVKQGRQASEQAGPAPRSLLPRAPARKGSLSLAQLDADSPLTSLGSSNEQGDPQQPSEAAANPAQVRHRREALAKPALPPGDDIPTSLDAFLSNVLPKSKKDVVQERERLAQSSPQLPVAKRAYLDRKKRVLRASSPDEDEELDAADMRARSMHIDYAPPRPSTLGRASFLGDSSLSPPAKERLLRPPYVRPLELDPPSESGLNDHQAHDEPKKRKRGREERSGENDHEAREPRRLRPGEAPRGVFLHEMEETGFAQLLELQAEERRRKKRETGGGEGGLKRMRSIRELKDDLKPALIESIKPSKKRSVAPAMRGQGGRVARLTITDQENAGAIADNDPTFRYGPQQEAQPTKAKRLGRGRQIGRPTFKFRFRPAKLPPPQRVVELNSDMRARYFKPPKDGDPPSSPIEKVDDASAVARPHRLPRPLKPTTFRFVTGVKARAAPTVELNAARALLDDAQSKQLSPLPRAHAQLAFRSSGDIDGGELGQAGGHNGAAYEPLPGDIRKHPLLRRLTTNPTFRFGTADTDPVVENSMQEDSVQIGEEGAVRIEEEDAQDQAAPVVLVPATSSQSSDELPFVPAAQPDSRRPVISPSLHGPSPSASPAASFERSALAAIRAAPSSPLERRSLLYLDEEEPSTPKRARTKSSGKSSSIGLYLRSDRSADADGYEGEDGPRRTLWLGSTPERGAAPLPFRPFSREPSSSLPVVPTSVVEAAEDGADDSTNAPADGGGAHCASLRDRDQEHDFGATPVDGALPFTQLALAARVQQKQREQHDGGVAGGGPSLMRTPPDSTKRNPGGRRL